MKTWVAAEVLSASDLNGEFDNILNNPVSLLSPLTGNIDFDGFDLIDLGELEFRDEAADPTADGRFRRSGDELTWRTQDARTNTTTRNFAIWSDTTGAPAASIGIGMLFQAESADENPSDFGALDFIATDVTAASEDTVLGILLRIAGAALTEAYRFQATAANRVTFTHAATAARTVTIPDADFTIPTSSATAATQAEMEAATSTSVFATPGRTQYHPGVAKAWGKWNNAGTLAVNYNITSITDTGVGDHTVNIGTDFSGADWTALFIGVSNVAYSLGATQAAGTVQVQGQDLDTPFASADATDWHFVGFGDQ